MFDLDKISIDLKKIVSNTMQLKYAVSVLEVSRQNQRIGHTDNVILVGNPGVGKSHIIKAFYRSHAPYDEKERTVVPVVKVSLSGKTSHLQCVQEILEAMGDQKWNKGTSKECDKRLYKLMKDNGVQMVIIDEAHNTLNKKSINSHVAMTLKGINNNTSVSIVLAGIDSVMDYREDPELKRRFKRVIRINHMGYKSDSEVKDFKKLIADMCQVLPVENAGELKTNDWVNRLYLVSEGIPDFIYTLFLESLRFIEPGETELTKKHFEKACMSFDVVKVF